MFYIRHTCSINVCFQFTASVWFEPTSYTVNENDCMVSLIVRTNIPGGPPNGSVQIRTVAKTALGT